MLAIVASIIAIGAGFANITIVIVNWYKIVYVYQFFTVFTVGIVVVFTVLANVFVTSHIIHGIVVLQFPSALIAMEHFGIIHC